MKEVLSREKIQEIFLSYHLNEQLISIGVKGPPVTHDSYTALRSFSLDNDLFEKVSKDPLINDLPLALIADLHRRNFFLTIHEKSWNRLLSEFLGGAPILDIDAALAGVFDDMNSYEKKTGVARMEDPDEDDVELYKFIEEYRLKKDAFNPDFDEFVIELHAMKTGAIDTISKSEGIFAQTGDDLLLIDLGGSQNAQRLYSDYVDSYCRNARALVEPRVDALAEIDLNGFLHSNQDRKASIREFISYALEVCNRESELMKKFMMACALRIYGDVPGRVIPVCSTSPFYYLNNPLPQP